MLQLRGVSESTSLSGYLWAKTRGNVSSTTARSFWWKEAVGGGVQRSADRQVGPIGPTFGRCVATDTSKMTVVVFARKLLEKIAQNDFLQKFDSFLYFQKFSEKCKRNTEKSHKIEIKFKLQNPNFYFKTK